jgi:hypothetical protein
MVGHLRRARMSDFNDIFNVQIKDPRMALTTEGVTDCKGVDMNNFSISQSDIKRFFEKVDIYSGIGHVKCWVWKNPLDNGYGRFWVNNKTKLAHRFSYEFFIGEIPRDKQLDHLCRNRSCVNPDHLEPVDIKTNVLRGEGLSAQNARKTHCKRNHPFSGENLKINCRGQRICLTCHRANVARWLAKK